MSWFIVDDKWHSHPKVVGLSLSAAGLWAKAGSWCGDHLTDGHVPRALPASWNATAEHVQELVNARLWVETDHGWCFHDWLARNPSRESVLAKRKADADRKARGRASQKPPRGGRKDSQRSPRGVRLDSNGPSPSPSPFPEKRESARANEDPEPEIKPPDFDIAWMRLGTLYKTIFDAEQAGSRAPRAYDEQRIGSTDSKQFRRLLELVRAEHTRCGAGERQIFTAAATAFLRDPKQREKGYVLEFLARDFHIYVDRSDLEVAS